MKEIKLTQGKVALVDDEDFELLNLWKWNARKDKNTFYAGRTIGQRRGEEKLNICMHRFIMNTPEGMEVDHIDHNGLNCQRSNMRNCIHADNGKNCLKKRIGKYRGVDINRGKYIVSHIRLNNKTIHLGTFKTEIDAARAYDKAAKENYGKFAILNFN